MDQAEQGPGSRRLEIDLDDGGARRHGARSFPAPGEHHPPVGDDLHELAARDVGPVAEVDPEYSAGPRIELSMPSLPADVLARIGEEAEDGLGRRRDTHFALNDLAVDVALHALVSFSVVPRAPRRA